MTKKQLAIAGKVLDERFDVRTLIVQMFHMAGAVQRILWRLNMSSEPLGLSYQKFAATFKDEVAEKWRGHLKHHKSWQRNIDAISSRRGPHLRSDATDHDAEQ